MDIRRSCRPLKIRQIKSAVSLSIIRALKVDEIVSLGREEILIGRGAMNRCVQYAAFERACGEAGAELDRVEQGCLRPLWIRFRR